IDEMNENRAALDVAQEAVAEAVSLVRALDESGDVGNDEGLVVVRADNAEVRDQGGEGIVGDLRFGRADHGDQRRFAGVRKTDQTDVSDQLQFDGELALFAGVAILREPRRLARGGGEVLIAPPAAPTFGDKNALAVVREVGDEIAGGFVADYGTDRKIDRDVVSVKARAVRAHAVLAAAGFPLAPELQVVERVEPLGGDDPNRAPLAAVATGWAAFRHELLAPESNTAFAAVSGLDLDGCLIDEHAVVSCRANGAPKTKRRSEERRHHNGKEGDLLGGGGDGRGNADVAPALALVMELHDAVDLGKERVIAA